MLRGENIKEVQKKEEEELTTEMRWVGRKETTAVAMVLALMTATVVEAWTFETLNEEYVKRNKWLQCAKEGWANCLKDMGGYNLLSGVLCPYALYWECEYAWRIGRRPIDQTDPYWDDKCCVADHLPGNTTTLNT